MSVKIQPTESYDAAEQQALVEAQVALAARNNPTDGRITGFQEVYFAVAALKGLSQFQEKYGDGGLRVEALSIRFKAYTSDSDGFQMSPQDMFMLKEAMPAYLAYLSRRTDICSTFYLQSARYLYSELEHAQDKGLYASMYAQELSPAKANLAAQAWLRQGGYLGPKEGIDSLIGGAVIHFVPPAKGKPMLILYSDQCHMLRSLQQAIYKDYLKWRDLGVKHILLEGEGPNLFQEKPYLNRSNCQGLTWRNMLLLQQYCAFDEGAMLGVDDVQATSSKRICHASYGLLSDINRRSEVMVDNIEKYYEDLHYQVALMTLGTAHVSYFIDELSKRGAGLMVIEMPQMHEVYGFAEERIERVLVEYEGR